MGHYICPSRRNVKFNWDELQIYCYLSCSRNISSYAIGHYINQLKISHEEYCTLTYAFANQIRNQENVGMLGTWNGPNWCSFRCGLWSPIIWNISPRWCSTRTQIPNNTFFHFMSSLGTLVFPFLVQLAEEVVYSIWAPLQRPDHYWCVITLLTGHHLGYKDFTSLLPVLWKFCLVVSVRKAIIHFKSE